MKKATTIFGSKSERRAFEAIDKHLPSGWRLYGNTPLSQIVASAAFCAIHSCMHYVLKLILMAVMLLSLTGVSSAKEWRGIVPLQSTRQDVLRLLGNPSDANSIRANYSLEKEDVYLVFSSEEAMQEFGLTVVTNQG